MTIVHMLLVAVATIGAQTTVPANPDQPVPKEKKVCRSEATTGSLLGKRICHTRAEWTDIDARNSADTDRFRDSQRRSTTHGS